MVKALIKRLSYLNKEKYTDLPFSVVFLTEQNQTSEKSSQNPFFKLVSTKTPLS